MTAEAQALAQVLLKHHQRVCHPRLGTHVDIDPCVITYGSLCEQAGLPFLTRAVGPFLREVAEWCTSNGWPPINALAVSKDTRIPGEGYDGAPGCSLNDWPAEAVAAIEFADYPATLP